MHVKLAGKGEDRLLSLLKRGGDNVLTDVQAHVKKQKLSCDYLKKIFLQECGEKLTHESTIEEFVQQLLPKGRCGLRRRIADPS